MELNLSNENVPLKDGASASQSTRINKLGVYLLTILGYKSSASIDNYTGAPFIKFESVDKNSQQTLDLMFWMPRQGDGQDRIDLKNRILKLFLVSLGSDTEALRGTALLDSAINRSAKVAVKERERVVIGKKDGKPLIITEIDYWYSGNANEPLSVNESKMRLPLDEAAKAQYLQSLAAWETNSSIGAPQQQPPPQPQQQAPQQQAPPDMNPFE